MGVDRGLKEGRLSVHMRGAGCAVMLAALCACAQQTGGSGLVGVRAVGADEYVASSRHMAARAGVLLAQNDALSEAHAFCKARGLEFLAVSSDTGHLAATDEATYTVNFRCLPPGSPELRLPTRQVAPDTML